MNIILINQIFLNNTMMSLTLNISVTKFIEKIDLSNY